MSLSEELGLLPPRMESSMAATNSWKYIGSDMRHVDFPHALIRPIEPRVGCQPGCAVKGVGCAAVGIAGGLEGAMAAIGGGSLWVVVSAAFFLASLTIQYVTPTMPTTTRRKAIAIP